MTTMKKLVALLLAAMMLLAVMNVAVATEEGTTATGVISITNAVAGQTYNAYRMLDLSYDAANSAYTYTVADAWTAFFAEGGAGLQYVNIDEQGYVTWKDGASAVELAAAALAWAEENIENADATVTAGDTTATMENLELGYYLVDSSLGALCSIDTTDTQVEIEEKNAVPEISKKVQEDSTEEWQDYNDADIGQTVNYKVEIKVADGAQNYILHDAMNDGLTFQNVSKITLKTSGEGETEETVVETTNYNVVSAVEYDESATTYCNGHYEKCDFHVEFGQAYIDTLKAGDVLTVYYSAVLNENATIGGPAEENNAALEYGDDNFTVWDEVETWTWDVEFFKYTTVTADGVETKKPLAGAKFTLYYNNNGEPGEVIKLTKVEGTHTAYDIQVDLYRVDPDGDVTEITTSDLGYVVIEGLDSDSYILVETEAPEGYNQLTEDIVINLVMNETGSGVSTSYQGAESGQYGFVQIENKSGTVLPSTGGIGTTIFYAVGGVLVLLAVVLLVTKRRVGEEN